MKAKSDECIDDNLVLSVSNKREKKYKGRGQWGTNEVHDEARLEAALRGPEKKRRERRLHSTGNANR